MPTERPYFFPVCDSKLTNFCFCLIDFHEGRSVSNYCVGGNIAI